MDTQEQVKRVPASLYRLKSFVELPAEIRSMIYNLAITHVVHKRNVIIYYVGQRFKH